ncbi:peptide-methionine (S)-S-oxide reductase MsrA [Orrella sp. JC864]|uniref:peptide-methionine (S)-S-oxide reductase MsrA n=1 Tax=Orrella sp. JC864 TaxID=3120298 RepID=UPI0012BD4A5C
MTTSGASGAGRQVAVFGGGCFWCVEAVFKPLRGVLAVTSGYSGGQLERPSYEQVCQGDTGHIEVARIEFDPAQVSYRDLLTVFFATHDPTTPDRQGNDVGPQYRSAIFWQDETQKREAGQRIAELEREGVFDAPIVTQLLPPAVFWPAEAVHHDYFARHPQQGYCQFVIAPKVAKMRKQFADKLAT